MLQPRTSEKIYFGKRNFIHRTKFKTGHSKQAAEASKRANSKRIYMEEGDKTYYYNSVTAAAEAWETAAGIISSVAKYNSRIVEGIDEPKRWKGVLIKYY